MPYQTDFHEVRFPTDIGFGSSGGPERSTEIVVLGSGREHRNQRWANSRRRYDAGYGVKDLNSLHEVIAFYEARRGPLYGFRYRDALDWKSCPPLSTPRHDDQVLGIGDGATNTFALVKNYGETDAEYQRAITKPVSDSVLIAIDGNNKIPGSDFILEPTTGKVTFTTSTVPPPGSLITAGFEFDVPVRFASDQLTISVAAFRAGDVPSIPLVEVMI